MILVSACLIRRDFQDVNANYLDWLAACYDARVFLPVCPAQLAGLPRMYEAELRRIHRVDYRRGPVLNQCQGMLVSESGERWPDAEDKLSVPLKRLILNQDISAAILAENSPTCGVHLVYDGHFRGKREEGQGIATTILQALSIPCYSSREITKLEVAQLVRKDLEYYYQA